MSALEKKGAFADDVECIGHQQLRLRIIRTQSYDVLGELCGAERSGCIERITVEY